MDTGIYNIPIAGETARRVNMLNEISFFADKYNMFPESGAVLACVSGGADSMCLLEALLEISRERGFTVSTAHYNHMLRGDESMRDESFVKEHCASRNVPFYSAAGDIKAYAAARRIGIEEAAREARYGFFIETAEEIGAARIATAHTADDNTETIIINLARGAGSAGLSGIPPVRGINKCADGRDGLVLRDRYAPGCDRSAEQDIIIIRPMLCISRADIMRFMSERRAAFIEDSSNSLDIYTRNKVRHIIIPVIRDINPKYQRAFGSAAELLRADEAYLSKIADEFIAERCGRDSADAGELLELPFAVSGRVIRKMSGRSLSLDHVKAVLELCKRNGPPARISLPGMNVYREYDRIVFDKGPGGRADGFEPIYPVDGDCVMIPGVKLKLSCKVVIYDDIINESIHESFTSFLFKYSELCGKMTVRPRRAGDAIKLSGQRGTKTLKKLFIERRIPERKRGLIPVVADDIGVLAVLGVGMGDRAVPEPGDLAFQIKFEELQ